MSGDSTDNRKDMKNFRGTSSAAFWIAGLALLISCSAQDPAQVSLILEDPTTSSVGVTSDITWENGFVARRSSRGLVTNRSCYLIHVTAPDLIVPGTQDSGGDSGTCPGSTAPKVAGLGVLFGPFAYGSEATVRVSAGPGRRFDLIGFVNPYANDPGCTKGFEYRVIDRPGSSDKNVVLRYGEYAIDPEDFIPAGLSRPDEPFGRIGFFAHSSTVTLSPGPQSVSLRSLAWIGTPEKPQTYGGGCGGDSNMNAYYPHFVSPFQSRVYKDSSGAIRTEHVFTGITHGNVWVQCPSGAHKIRLHYSDQLSSEVNALPSGPQFTNGDNANVSLCEEAGKAEFPISFWDSHHVWNSNPPNEDGNSSNDSMNGWMRAIRLQALNADDTVIPTSTVVFRINYSPRYMMVKQDGWGSGGGPSWSTTSDVPLKFNGFRQSGSLRFVYFDERGSSGSSPRMMTIQPQISTTGTRSPFDWNGTPPTQLNGSAPFCISLASSPKWEAVCFLCGAEAFIRQHLGFSMPRPTDNTHSTHFMPENLAPQISPS